MLCDVGDRIASGALLCFDAIDEVASWTRKNMPDRKRPRPYIPTPEQLERSDIMRSRMYASRIAISIWRLLRYGSMTLNDAQVMIEIESSGREYEARREKREKAIKLRLTRNPPPQAACEFSLS